MTTIRCYVVMRVIPCLLGPSRPFPGSLGLEAQAKGDENRGHKSVQSRPSRPGLLSASPVSQGGRGRRAESAAAAAAALGWPPKSPPSATDIPAGGGRALLSVWPEVRWRPLVAKFKRLDFITGGCRRLGWNPWLLSPVPTLLGLPLCFVF